MMSRNEIWKIISQIERISQIVRFIGSKKRKTPKYQQSLIIRKYYHKKINISHMQYSCNIYSAYFIYVYIFHICVYSYTYTVLGCTQRGHSPSRSLRAMSMINCQVSENLEKGVSVYPAYGLNMGQRKKYVPDHKKSRIEIRIC